jgi:hypothetical protein
MNHEQARRSRHPAPDPGNGVYARATNSAAGPGYRHFEQGSTCPLPHQIARRVWTSSGETDLLLETATGAARLACNTHPVRGNETVGNNEKR